MSSDLRRRALEELAETGPLTPSRLIEAASDPDHPWHDRFEWDDTKAAHEFRLQQARHIIVSVTEMPEGGTKPIPVFIHIPGRGEGEYAPSRVVVSQPDRWQLARDETLRYLDAARRSVDDLDEIVRVYGSPSPGARPRIARASRSLTRASRELAEV